MTQVALILAVARNRVIGRADALPWHLPDDLKRFRRLTMGKPVVMGRRTWESLPRPLDGRRCIVLSATPQAGDCETVPNAQAALALCEADAEVMVAGGVRVFEAFFPLCHRVHRTLIDADVDGDVLLPDWDWSAFSVVREEFHAADDRHAYAFTAQELVRQGAPG